MVRRRTVKVKQAGMILANDYRRGVERTNIAVD